MTHIRIFKQSIPVQLVLLALLEYGLLWGAAVSAHQLRQQLWASSAPLLPAGFAPHLYAAVMMLCMIAMGSYQLRGSEGLTGLMLRAVVAVFLIGTVVVTASFYVLPGVQDYLGRGALALASTLAIAAIGVVRIVFYKVLDLSHLRWRVLIVGAGRRANRVLEVMGETNSEDVELVGCISIPTDSEVVPAERLIATNKTLQAYCQEARIQEIVVAVDERRRGESGGFPLEELLDCKLAGIEVLDEISFYEREMGKIDTRLLSPGWLVYSNGFAFSPWRDFFERGFDVAASLLLLLLTWPVMLLTALAIKLEEGWRAPIFYNQERVGYRGRGFMVHKFRSMRVDAEKAGKPIWASKSDSRITRVGHFIRNTRIDELPQILNVFKGQMSFVGPRPERPQFVEDLAQEIPFYNERHRVKPGITGWAQLCYPYGASLEDAEQKLQYDLYYIKNHSLIFDLFILVRTVEVILLGGGAR